MKLIVGLGNPGSKYAETRHNVGFQVLDALSGRWQIELCQEKFHAWFARGRIADQEVVLLKPTTFMNRSGQAVQAAGRFYQLELADLLVISDDWALPMGKLRLRSRGGAGGHKGLGDIINRLGSNEFSRLRVGIEPPRGNPVTYVLATFSSADQRVISDASIRAMEAIECWISDGIDSAMNRYNSDSNEG